MTPLLRRCGKTCHRCLALQSRLTAGSAGITLISLHRIREETLCRRHREEEPNEPLVVIFESEQESEAMVVESLLQSAGIDVLVTNFDAPQDILPGVGGVKLQVREDQAEEARAILAEYQDKGLTESRSGRINSPPPPRAARFQCPAIPAMRLPRHPRMNPAAIHVKRDRPEQIRAVGSRPVLRQAVDHLRSADGETDFVSPPKSPRTRAVPRPEILRTTKYSSRDAPP